MDTAVGPAALDSDDIFDSADSAAGADARDDPLPFDTVQIRRPVQMHGTIGYRLTYS